jgi:hypothetical protein
MAGRYALQMVAWLIGAGIGPALVGLPVNLAGEAGAGAAKRWFLRLRRKDGLSRLVRAAGGTSVDLTRGEFGAVRHLLEDEQTWHLAGRGTIEDLAALIASCLPPRGGRTAEDSHAAARTIARGLLEFAVADLEPDLFQQVLLARLQRMETGQASALDEALLGLHADLVARLTALDDLDASRFTGIMGHLGRVLDRLPPGPADRGEIAVYLATLISWLNSDPWPRDRRFGGPVLTPAAIERKLQVSAAGWRDKQYLDADDLVQHCRRLVILGGPGSGKTWLAKRSARLCAEEALRVLAAGGSVSEVELPLYTTCSRLLTASGSIREAAVSSALDQLGDMGGARLSAAVRALFTERNSPTMLVIDSLDEAPGSDERLRQADTLPWRIVLTSRPSSWNQQLIIEQGADSHRFCELQPLRYPEDADPFIRRWFAGRPEWGTTLADQIAQRPSLQQAATVPLILAFYCILGGDQPLPDSRHDLYSRVLRRMLTGRWRGSEVSEPDADICLKTLRDWAWSGAASDPVSGMGTWADDIAAGDSGLSKAQQGVLDHVAMPVGPCDIDTGKTLRRFIHRSIREHLVAEHVALLPVDQAVRALLPHLWLDHDWEYVAPAAIAAHPQHDQLVRDLTALAADSDQMPVDLASVDWGFSIRELLSRVASESSETDWSPQVAAMITRARADLAQQGLTDALGTAPSWETSNRQARRALLSLLDVTTYFHAVVSLATAVVKLGPAANDERRARQTLLRRAETEPVNLFAEALTSGLARLNPTEKDKCEARQTLLRRLEGETNGLTASELVEGLTRLNPTVKDKREARQTLLRRLETVSDGLAAEHLTAGLIALNPTAPDKRQARQALLRHLGAATYHSSESNFVEAVVELAGTPKDKRQARKALLTHLDNETEDWKAVELIDGLVRLTVMADDVAAHERRQLREELLDALTARDDSGEPGRLVGHEAARVAEWVAQLDPTTAEKRQAREALLWHLPREPLWWIFSRLTRGMVRLDPTADEKRQAREALLRHLARETSSYGHHGFAHELAPLDATAEDKRYARAALLKHLDEQTHGKDAARTAGVVAQLDATAGDKRQARAVLLRLLAAGETDDRKDERHARMARLGIPVGETDGKSFAQLARTVAELDPTAKDRQQACGLLLDSLTRETDQGTLSELVHGMALLDPTEKYKRLARQAIFRLLNNPTYMANYESTLQASCSLADSMARLDPCPFTGRCEWVSVQGGDRW